jgi:hypothetical protein
MPLPGKTLGPEATAIANLAAPIGGRAAIVSPENLPGNLLAVSKISQYKKALVVFSGLY